MTLDWSYPNFTNLTVTVRSRSICLIIKFCKDPVTTMCVDEKLHYVYFSKFDLLLQSSKKL